MIYAIDFIEKLFFKNLFNLFPFQKNLRIIYFRKGRTYTPLLKVGVLCEEKKKGRTYTSLFKLMYRARSFALFYCEILRCKIKNSFHSCKNKNKFWKASNGFVPQTPKIYFVILVGKQRVCSYKPQNFVLACLLGRKFSFDLFCRFARLLGGNKKSNRN